MGTIMPWICMRGENETKECTFPATIDHIETATNFVNEYLDEIECPMRIQMQIAIVIDEIFGNVAHYAYDAPGGEVTVGVNFNEETNAIMLSFTDQGVAYNPLEKEDPDITLSAEERKIGGMGIFMVKKLMDHITYEYKNNQNILSMWKKID